MRRDVFIENGAERMSVLSPHALQDALEREPGFEARHLARAHAIILGVRGDDAMLVRVVVDEPLTRAEESQWLARVRWTLEAPDGRLVIAGGRDAERRALELGGERSDETSRHLAVVRVPPGHWRIDLYTHVGSTNGRRLLRASERRLGSWFRVDAPGSPFPLWLASHLASFVEEDPGFEALWRAPTESLRRKALAIDTAVTGFVGFLVHVRRAEEGEALITPPTRGGFELDAGARAPDLFPRGLPAGVEDPQLLAFARHLLERDTAVRRGLPAPIPMRCPQAVFEVWDGPPATRLEGSEVALELPLLVLGYLLALLSSNTMPNVELRIREAGDWVPPPPQSDFAIECRGVEYRVGPPENLGGWAMLSSLVTVGQMLAALPDGALLELATRVAVDPGEAVDSASGRLFLKGRVIDGRLRIAEASPPSPRGTLEDAMAFARELLMDQEIRVRDAVERAVVDGALGACAASFDSPPPRWGDQRLSLAGADSRLSCLIARPLFRHRYRAMFSATFVDGA